MTRIPYFQRGRRWIAGVVDGVVGVDVVDRVGGVGMWGTTD